MKNNASQAGQEHWAEHGATFSSIEWRALLLSTCLLTCLKPWYLQNRMYAAPGKTFAAFKLADLQKDSCSWRTLKKWSIHVYTMAPPLGMSQECVKMTKHVMCH